MTDIRTGTVACIKTDCALIAWFRRRRER